MTFFADMSSPIKNALVTGGSGFMGSHFIRYLYNQYRECRIFNLDLLTYAGNNENLKDIGDGRNGRYQFIKGDVCDSELLENLFKRQKFDLIFHFAAETHVDRSMYNVSDFIRTNVEGTRVLLEALRKHGIPRLVHISTDEVYGDISEGFADENAPLRPSNPYATSKACGDLLVQAYIKTYGVPAIIVRPSNNFGTHQYPEKLIPMAITNVIEGHKIPIHGSGRHIRSWLHVNDLASGVDLAAFSGRVGSVYNLSGETKTNLEILNLVAKHLGADLDQFKEHVGDRPAADFRYAPDSSKIQQELGWRRKHNLDSQLGGVVNWYLQNKEWWSKIKAQKEYRNHYAKQSKAEWY